MKIAVFIGGIIYDSQKGLIMGIKSYARKHKIDVHIFTCGGDIYSTSDHNKGEFQIYSLPDIEEYDGIIFAPDTIQNEKVVKEITERVNLLNIPVVSIDSYVAGANCYYTDNFDAMYKITSHMIGVHDRRHILYISGPKENKESIDRLQGFISSVKDFKGDETITYDIRYGDYWIDSGRTIMRDYLDNHEKPDAVICANDFMASGALDILVEKGIKVPADVVISGFDNSYESKFSIVRLSTVEKPQYKIGYEACKKVCQKSDKEPEYKSFPVRYIFADSCGCIRSNKSDDTEIKKKLASEKYSNRLMAEYINTMSADMNEVDNLTDFVDKLKNNIVNMNFPYFYLCLCEENEGNELVYADGKYSYDRVFNTEYTDKVNVVIAYENGNFHETTTINKREVIPARHIDENIMAVVVPIHFRTHCLGYCVVGNSNLPMETLQFESWIMNIGNALENIHKQTVMKKMIERLNKMWIYDTMTGVLNRAGFYLKAKGIIATCQKEELPLIIIFADIDHLKYVNDNLGHEEGDYYIKTVADICSKNCPKHGIVMRYGGDEFVMMTPLYKELEYENIIDRIRQEVAQKKIDDHKPYEMSVSMGSHVAVIDENFSLERLIDTADREMYKIKHAR